MTNGTCIGDGCDRAAVVRDRCDRHYRQARKAGQISNLPRATGPGTSCRADGCSAEVESGGLCAVHRSRERKTGSFEKRTRANGEAMAVIRAGAESVGDGPCVMLTMKGGARPSTTLTGKNMSASRAAWIIATGEDPGERWVLHTCGMGAEGCVRFGHLYLGDGTDNADDRMYDGGQAFGSSHQNAKLSEADIAAIRATPRAPAGRPRKGATYVTADELAARYGVSRGAISAIQNGRGWHHI